MAALRYKLTLPALLAAFLLTACAAFSSPTAEASVIRRCDIPSLTPRDAARARLAAKKASKGKLAEFDVSDACRYPGGASLIVRTPRITNAESAEEWWFLLCGRHGTGSWSCDEPQPARAADMRLTVEGIERTIHLSFDAGVTFTTLRPLVKRVFEQYYEPATALEACALHGSMLLETDLVKARAEARHTPGCWGETLSL